MASVPRLDETLELAQLLTPAWGAISDGIPAWHPRCEVSGGEGGEGAGTDGGDGGGDGGDKDDAGTTSKTESVDEWKGHARKHEKRAKALQAELEAEREKHKTDQEKAIDKARKEAREEALTEAEQERRKDRLENATIRVAAKGLKVGSGDKEQTLKFADPDDALIYLERDLASGEVDADDIFDKDGKVQTDAVTKALTALLERKPHLRASNAATTVGDGDGGKGAAAGGSFNDTLRARAAR